MQPAEPGRKRGEQPRANHPDNDVGYREIPVGSGTSGGEQKQLMTMWVGVQAVIVGLSVPGLDTEGLETTVDGKRLLLRGRTPEGLFVQETELPYEVEGRPIRIHDQSGICHLLFRKSGEAARPRIDDTLLTTVRHYFSGPGGKNGRTDAYLLNAIERYFRKSEQSRPKPSAAQEAS